jgi:hypothetical protein
LQLQEIHQNLASEENLQSWLHLGFFNFKEPWVPWILALFPFSGTHGPTPEQLFTLLKIPVLVFSKKKSKVGTNMKNYECICFMSACSLQWIPEQA